jgi:MoaA/NifB/PqqE/SkfB family radical SAM enzyme
VEIYAVLNDRSVVEMEDYAAWLLRFADVVSYFPFPVRGPHAEQYKIRPDQIPLVDAFVDRYDDFAPILPPRAYFARLLRFYHEGKRTFRCHVPRLVISTFSDGVVTPCPNIWFSDMGNVLDDDYEASLEKVGKTGLYQALLDPKPRLAACHGCFTPWDTLSMYFEDEITLDELCAAPTYAPEPIRKLVARLKEEWKLEEARAASRDTLAV